MQLSLFVFAVACSDYSLGGKPDDPLEGERRDAPEPLGPGEVEPVPQVALEPAAHDFGTLDLGRTAEVPLTLSNVGGADLHVSSLTYTGVAELIFDPDEVANGALPWTLAPGESRELFVDYVPVDTDVDEGELLVASDDPSDPVVAATQVGAARPFDFSVGWYIYEHPAQIETFSNADRQVDRVGDPDGYWYEPSGLHGMLDSTDVETDFGALHDWVVALAGAPVPVTGPLTFRSASTVSPLEGATFTYILCDFWLDSTDDPSLYAIHSGVVDDGIAVIVNGEILGNLEYGQSGSWALANAVAGEVNTLVVILQDNAEVEKYLVDLAFYRDGVMVGGS